MLHFATATIVEPIMYATLYKQASNTMLISVVATLCKKKGQNHFIKNPKLPNGLFFVSDKQSFLVDYHRISQLSSINAYF